MPVIDVGNGLNESAVSGLILSAIEQSVSTATDKVPASALLKSVKEALETLIAEKATPAQITTAINNLIASAPGALDTLNELATALGNDANFATTITNLIAGKQATLENQTNIKSINGNNLLGAGDLTIGNATNFTYGENITAGDPVYLKESDGKVYKMPTNTVTVNTSAFDTVNLECKPSTAGNTILALGKDSTGNISLKCATLSGTTATWGTKVTLYSSATSPTNYRIIHNSSQNVYVIIYNDPTNSNYLTLVACSISGTIITLGTPVVVSITFNTLTACDLVGSAYCIVGYYEITGSSNRFRTVSVSGTTLTLNSTLNASGATGTAIGVCFDADYSRIYAITSNQPSYIAELANTSGTLSVIKGSLTSGYSNSIGIFTVFTINAEIVMFARKNNLFALMDSVSPSTATFLVKLSPITITSSNDYFSFRKTFLTFKNNNNSLNIVRSGKYLVITSSYVDTQIINVDTFSVIYFSQIVGVVSQRGLFVTQHVIGLNGSVVTSSDTPLKLAITPLRDYTSVIGIAGSSGTAGETKSIVLKNSIYSTTDLTMGATYYLSSSGGITTDQDDYVIGRAISTTQLLVGA